MRRFSFFVLVISLHETVFALDLPRRSANSTDLAECRNRIAEIVCVKENQGCRQSKKYSDVFEDLFDAYPERLQRVFCFLNEIYVDPKYFGSAYTGMHYDRAQKKYTGAYLGVRQSLLDQVPSLEKWASWKEQLSFGSKPKTIQVDSTLPVVSIRDHHYPNFLWFLVAHEIGHIVDHGNGVNQFKRSRQLFVPISGTWGDMDWRDRSDPKQAYQFPLVDRLCFYHCPPRRDPNYQKRIVPKALGRDLFIKLEQKTRFLTTYSTLSAREDFAEAFAFHFLFKGTQTQFEIKLGNETLFDVRRVYYSQKFKKKREFLEKFLSNRNLNFLDTLL